MRKTLAVFLSLSAIAIARENWRDEALIKLVQRYYELSQKVEKLEKELKDIKENYRKEQGEETIKPKLVANKNTYIRTCPSTKCKILALVKSKEVVELLEVKGNWYKVRNTLGVQGWVYTKDFSELSY